MKKQLSFPAWANRAWVAQKLFPQMAGPAALAALEAKLSGVEAWSETELEQLGELFIQIEETDYGEMYWAICEDLFGPPESDPETGEIFPRKNTETT